MLRMTPWLFAALELPILALQSLGAAEQLSARQILEKVAQPREGLNDYVCTVTLSANSPKVHIEKATATMYYKRPHKFHFKSKEGVALFPKQAFSADWVSSELAKKVDLKIVESGKHGGVTVHRIRVTDAANPDKGHVDLLVDGDHYLLKGIEVAVPSGEMPSMTVTHRKVAGKFWLPKRTILKAPVPGSKEPATFTITFSDYRVNVGLSDELFESKQPP